MSAPKLQHQTIEQTVSLPGRDDLKLTLEVVNGEITQSKLSGSGCGEFLRLMQAWRPRLNGRLELLPVPEGNSHSELLLREAILKAKGEWDFPYKEEELCHCRAVATSKVDAAIVGGCRTTKEISRETSAGTSCGSCRLDSEAILKYRLR